MYLYFLQASNVFTLSADVSIIKVHKSRPTIGGKADLLGWGDEDDRKREPKSNSPRANILKIVKLRVLNNSACILSWRPYAINETHICAQGKGKYHVSKIFI